MAEVVSLFRSNVDVRRLFIDEISAVPNWDLARESSLANNTLAAEYVEQLSDLLAVIPSYQWDADKDVPLQRRSAKFHFVNLSVALSFCPNRMTQISDFDALESRERAKWIEWLVAQELFRRQCIAGVEDPEAIWYWAPKAVRRDFVEDVATSSYNTGVMKTVGVRDLKNKLSEYLRRVRLGESVLVTDRGEVVAELLPPGLGQGDPSVPAGLHSLVRRGLLTLGAPAGTNLYPALPRKQGGRRRSVVELLDEERGSR